MSGSRRGPRETRHRVVAAGLGCLLLVGCGTEPGDGDPEPPAPDWRNTSYTLTCDGVLPGGFRAPVVDGRARVPADPERPPYYEYYDVWLAATASGDLDGDRSPDTAVLLECSPQPSNGIVQEVLVLSAAGRPLGTLPSPRTLQGDAPLPPVYDPAGLEIEDGEIVAAMTAYAPDDSHASGPSVPFTVRWRLDRQGFVRVSAS